MSLLDPLLKKPIFKKRCGVTLNPKIIGSYRCNFRPIQCDFWCWVAYEAGNSVKASENGKEGAADTVGEFVHQIVQVLLLRKRLTFHPRIIYANNKVFQVRRPFHNLMSGIFAKIILFLGQIYNIYRILDKHIYLIIPIKKSDKGLKKGYHKNTDQSLIFF